MIQIYDSLYRRYHNYHYHHQHYFSLSYTSSSLVLVQKVKGKNLFCARKLKKLTFHSFGGSFGYDVVFLG